MAAPAPNRIESFNLFGEFGELPDVVHCETISARSVLTDWEFVPHRHARLHQCLLIERGGGLAYLEDETFELRPGVLINVPVGAVHGFSFLKGTEGWVVTLASEVLDQVLTDSDGVRRCLSRPTVVHSDEGQRQVVERIFVEYSARDFARAHILRALSALLLGHVARTIDTAEGGDAAEAGHPLVKRFERLVDRHFAEHLGVAEYARRLSVSAPHLSRICRQSVGLPASRVIEDRLIREARRQLIYTNLGVGEIAHLLGFLDPAHFSRVFARGTGASPRAFRKRLERLD